MKYKIPEGMVSLSEASRVFGIPRKLLTRWIQYRMVPGYEFAPRCWAAKIEELEVDPRIIAKRKAPQPVKQVSIDPARPRTRPSNPDTVEALYVSP